MNYKQTAEEYVRKEIPELMELKRGTRGRLKKGMPVKTWFGSDPLRKFLIVYNSVVLGVRKDGTIYLNDITGEHNENDFDIVNIPNIFHYATVLTKIGKQVYFSETRWSLYLHCEYFTYKANKDNLTTSIKQPAIEYKAICELLGLIK